MRLVALNGRNMGRLVGRAPSLSRDEDGVLLRLLRAMDGGNEIPIGAVESINGAFEEPFSTVFSFAFESSWLSLRCRRRQSKKPSSEHARTTTPRADPPTTIVI